MPNLVVIPFLGNTSSRKRQIVQDASCLFHTIFPSYYVCQPTHQIELERVSGYQSRDFFIMAILPTYQGN